VIFQFDPEFRWAVIPQSQQHPKFAASFADWSHWPVLEGWDSPYVARRCFISTQVAPSHPVKYYSCIFFYLDLHCSRQKNVASGLCSSGFECENADRVNISIICDAPVVPDVRKSSREDTAVHEQRANS